MSLDNHTSSAPGGATPFEIPFMVNNFKLPDPAPEMIEEAEKPAKKKKKVNSRELLAMLKPHELFHDAAGTAYATFYIKDVCVTALVNSEQFRKFLIYRYLLLTNKALIPSVVEQLVNTATGIAENESCQLTVATRIYGDLTAIYLSLGSGKVVKIDSTGVTQVFDPLSLPVRFIERKDAHALPVPQNPETLEEARAIINEFRKAFLNPASDADFVRFLVFWIYCYVPAKVYPVLFIKGQEGSAKSTQAKIVKCSVDPHVATFIKLPTDDRDGFVSAKAHAVTIYDNVSHLNQSQSDFICKISTGGGFSTRELYTNSDVVSVQLTQPQIITSIAELNLTGDLSSRLVSMTCPKPDDNAYRDDTEFWQSFDNQLPVLIGALFRILSEVLRVLPDVSTKRSARLAGFYRFGCAVETVMSWTPETFANAYDDMRDVLAQSVLDTPLGEVITSHLPFEGSPQQVWLRIRLIAQTYFGSFPMDFPKTANGFHTQLTRMKSAFECEGITITRIESKWCPIKKDRIRWLSIKRSDNAATADAAKTNNANEAEYAPPTEFAGGNKR